MHKRILVVLDDDPASAVALAKGIEMAQALHAEILFFYVPARPDIILGDEITGLSNVPEGDFHSDLAAKAAQKLAEAAEIAETEGVYSHRIVGVNDDPGRRVAEAAQSRHCQMIVVATEKKNAVMRLISGNIVPRLISLASVPVLVCSPSSEVVEAVAADVGSKKRRRRVRSVSTSE